MLVDRWIHLSTAIVVIIVVAKFVFEVVAVGLLVTTIEGSSGGAAVASEAILPDFAKLAVRLAIRPTFTFAAKQEEVVIIWLWSIEGSVLMVVMVLVRLSKFEVGRVLDQTGMKTDHHH